MKKPWMSDFSRRFLAGLLCMVMVLSMLPLSALAEDSQETTQTVSVPETVSPAPEPVPSCTEAVEPAVSQEDEPAQPIEPVETQAPPVTEPQETTSAQETVPQETQPQTGSGDASTEPSETPPAETAGETTGEAVPETTGETVGETTAETTEETVSETTEETVSETTEETVGETTEETVEETTEELPITEYFYTDSMGRTVHLQGLRLPEDGISFFSVRDTFSTVETAAVYLRSQMEARNTEVVLTYQDDSGGITDSNWQDIEEEIFAAALTHTGVPTQGDYLRWHWGPRRGAAASYTSTSLTITFYIEYYTTANQEAYVASQISQVLGSMDLAGKSDYAKILEVYRFICSSVTYDHANLNDSSYTLKFSAYAALANHTAVCQGYALLMYRMLLTLGIDCRLIAGISNGEAHAWNIARVNNLYYNLDSTWDAGAGSKFSYFLRSNANFPNHTRSTGSQANDLNYNSGDFNARYPMGTQDAVDVPPAEADSGSCGSNLTWSLDSYGTLTISGTGAMESFSSRDAVPWQEHTAQITNLVIDEGITSIGSYAFQDCSNLARVTLPQDLASIEACAFSGCAKLSRVALPGSLVSIGDSAFSGCSGLDSVCLPDGLTTIGASAFRDCQSMVQLQLCDSLTRIEDGAFAGCSGLSVISLPRDLTVIGDNAFAGCTGLETLTFLGGAPRIDGTAFSDVQATVYYPGDDPSWTASLFQNYGGILTWFPCGIDPDADFIDFGSCGTNLMWTLDPQGVLTIEGSGSMTTFAYGQECDWEWAPYQSQITSVVIRSGVTTLGEAAFFGCTNLTSLSIADTVTEICADAFALCTGLAGVQIPGSVLRIGDEAFAECSALTTLTLSEGLDSIGECAFYNCESLAGLSLPGSLTSIEAAAFYGCSGLTTLSIPDGICVVEDYAFSYCSGLTSLSLPDSVSYIGEYTFYACESLPQVVLPSALAYVGEGAFAYCSRVKKLIFTGSAPVIQSNAFYGVTASVQYPLAYKSSWSSLVGKNYGGKLTWRVAYPITYVLNGGVNSPSNPDAYSLATVPVTLQAPTWEHHDFLGWYSDAALTKKVTGLTSKDTGAKTFYAKWKDTVYTVCWISEGSVYASDGMIFGQEPTPPALNPEKAPDENYSYLFAGWAAQEDGSVLSAFPAVSGNVCYYAVYTPTIRMYQIRYILNGGINDPSNPTDYAKELGTALADPTREGFRFAGWYTGSDYTQQILQITPQDRGDMTLYARWIPEVTTIVYDLNEPSALFPAPLNSYVNPVQLSINQKPMTLKAPGTVTGYRFLGWERDGEIVTSIGYDPSGSITLTARWEAVPYAITYKNVPAGVVNPNPSTYTVEGLTLEGLVSEGYEFVGWYSDSALKKAVTQLAPKATGKKTLYAKLIGHTYFVRFDPNADLFTGTMKDLKTQYGKKATLTANAYKRPGYSFLGWNTQPDGSGTFYANSTSVQNLSQAEGSVITLYAQWVQTGSSYTICFDPNGGQGTMADKTAAYGKAVTLSANAYQRSGYTFSGWNTQSDGSGKTYANKVQVRNLLPNWDPDGSNCITLYAQWKPVVYKITYTLNSGKNSADNPKTYTVESGEIPLLPATRTNYTFLGWSLTKTTPTFVSSIDSLGKKNLTLYAMWSLDTYTVSYDPNGGTGTMNSRSANWGSSWTLAANTFTRPGYRFLRWNTQPDGSGTSYSNKASVKNLPQVNLSGETESVTLYAQWVSNTYTVHFDANARTTGTTRDLTAAYAKAYTLPANGFVRPGYTFLGWNTQPDGSGKSYANKAQVKNLVSDAGTQITLYARWTPNQYTLVFDPNGGTGRTAAMVNISRTKSVTLTANGFARPGYTFSGWNTQPDGSGKAYANKAQVKALCTDPQGVVTLYAQWKLKTYKITYKLNGGKAATNPTSYTVISDPVTLAAPVRSGYTFVGWYTASGVEVTRLPAGYQSDLTLYARWSKP